MEQEVGPEGGKATLTFVCKPLCFPPVCIYFPGFPILLDLRRRDSASQLLLETRWGRAQSAPSRFSAVPEWGAPPGVRSWITDFSQYYSAECQKQGLLKHQAQDGFLHHTMY